MPFNEERVSWPQSGHHCWQSASQTTVKYYGSIFGEPNRLARTLTAVASQLWQAKITILKKIARLRARNAYAVSRCCFARWQCEDVFPGLPLFSSALPRPEGSRGGGGEDENIYFFFLVDCLVFSLFRSVFLLLSGFFFGCFLCAGRLAPAAAWAAAAVAAPLGLSAAARPCRCPHKGGAPVRVASPVPPAAPLRGRRFAAAGCGGWPFYAVGLPRQ